MRLILRAVRPRPSSLKSFLVSPGTVGNQLIRAVADADGEATGAGPRASAWGGRVTRSDQSDLGWTVRFSLSLSHSLTGRSRQAGACRVGQLHSCSKFAPCILQLADTARAQQLTKNGLAPGPDQRADHSDALTSTSPTRCLHGALTVDYLSTYLIAHLGRQIGLAM